MLKNILIIIVVLIIIECIWFAWYSKNYKNLSGSDELDKHLTNYLKHEQEMKQYFKRIMRERGEMLKNMTYSHWLDYNKKHCIVEFNGVKYYLFIYEMIDKSAENVLRVSGQPEMLNLNFSLERDLMMKKYQMLEEFPPFKILPEEMGNMDMDDDGFNEIAYFWEDPFLQRPIKKNTIFSVCHKEQFDCLIGIGYTTEDLISKYENIYYNYVPISKLIFFNIVIFMTPVILYLIDTTDINFIKSLIILIVSWSFFIAFLSQTTIKSTIAIENEKLNQIAANILGASFLTGVSIFIIGLLDNSKKINNKKVNNTKILQTVIFLFAIVVILLLFSLVKFNNYKSVDDLKNQRISVQIFYNYSIFYNIVICVLFTVFVFENYHLLNMEKVRTVFGMKK